MKQMKWSLGDKTLSNPSSYSTDQHLISPESITVNSGLQFRSIQKLIVKVKIFRINNPLVIRHPEQTYRDENLFSTIK